jgi:type I restriction enzyme, S subunit
VAVDVADEWPVVSIGELASAEDGAIAIGPFGSSMKADTYTHTGIPVVRGNNLVGRPGFFGDFVFVSEAAAARLARCLVRPGDLVFPHRGAIGEVGLVIDQGFAQWMLSTSMMKLRPDPGRLDSRFAFFFFRSSLGRHQLLKNASQVGTPGIGQPLASLRACELALPSLDDQQAIAGVLAALDDKIEQNRRTARALERLARAIFQVWFVDFEPVKAKAAGATTFPSMPQPVFDALPTRFVDSDIGPVPEGWMPKAVSSVFEVNPVRSLRKNGPAPYLDMKNMPTEGHAPQSWMMRQVGSGMRFMNGDTLVARITPCLENGKTAFVDFLGDGQIAWGSTEYIVLRPKAPLPPVFAYCLARTDEFRNFAIQNMTGTSGRQRVTPTAMDHFQIAVPSAAIAVGFGEIVQPLFRCIRAGMSESRALAEIRDYLLPKLLGGAIRPDAMHG